MTIEIRRAQQVKDGKGVTVWVAGYVSQAPLPNRAPFPSLVPLGYTSGEMWGHEVVADSHQVALEKMRRDLTCWGVKTVVCVDNSEYPCSLELGKAYIVVPDNSLEPEDIRVIDESGEDYIYSASYFSSSFRRLESS